MSDVPAQTKKKVIGIGQIMMRIRCAGAFLQANEAKLNIAGTEFNMLAAMSQLFCVPTEMVTSMPDHMLGLNLFNQVRAFGVGVTDLKLLPFSGVGERIRLPIFYTDGVGESIVDRGRGTGPFYAEQRPWLNLCHDAGFLLSSGITVGLEPKKNAERLAEAAAAVDPLGCQFVFDLGYRPSQWENHGELPAFVRQCEVVLPHVHILSGSEKLLEAQFGDPVRLFDTHPKLQMVITTLRTEHSAAHHEVGVRVRTRSGEAHESEMYPLSLVDRVGGGDAAVGVLLGAWLTGVSLQDAVKLAAAGLVHVSMTEGDQLFARFKQLHHIAERDLLSRR